MMTITMLVGLWTTTCIQTQISNSNQGYVKESYRVEKSGDFEFKRAWFRDSKCSEPNGTDVESGTLVVGEKINSFFHGDIYSADFSTQSGVDLGAVTVKQGKYLQVARGIKNSSMRNTMLSLFEYFRQ